MPHSGEFATRPALSFADLTLLNSWVNFGAPFANGGYAKDQFGIVRLRGVVRLGTSATAIIATLPTGYRPAFQSMHAIVSGSIFARLDVFANGDIQMVTGGTTGFVGLDGITFAAA